MFNYTLLEALAAVVREGSFERAALALHLTPSAVSQRVKLLEQRTGQVLVVRAAPCTATPTGLKLCRHVQAVGLLELDLQSELPPQWPMLNSEAYVTLKVAVNADSLATWFVAAATHIAQAAWLLLDLSLDDEAHTADRLKAGDVSAAVTTLATPVQGCRSVALGRLRYIACASPAFIAQHFSAGVHAQSLAAAPCLTFNMKDRLQDHWMQHHTGVAPTPPRHWLPSTQAFVDASLAGLGWGLNPAVLVQPHIDSGALRPLLDQADWQVPLHWQHPRLASPLLARVTDAVLAAARGVLVQEEA